MPGPETLDRRPSATRNLRVSQAAAMWLARQGVSANAISVAGMVCGMAAGVVLAATAQPLGPTFPAYHGTSHEAALFWEQIQRQSPRRLRTRCAAWRPK